MDVDSSAIIEKMRSPDQHCGEIRKNGFSVLTSPDFLEKGLAKSSRVFLSCLAVCSVHYDMRPLILSPHGLLLNPERSREKERKDRVIDERWRSQ